MVIRKRPSLKPSRDSKTKDDEHTASPHLSASSRETKDKQTTQQSDTAKQPNGNKTASKAETTDARAFIRASALATQTHASQTTSIPAESSDQTDLKTVSASESNPLPANHIAVLRETEARNTILSHVSIAISFGIVPVPLFDFVAIGGTQLHMIRELALLHAVPFDDTLGRSLLTGLAGGALPLLASAGMASAAKFVPGTGSLVGGATLAVTAGALTWAIGTLFARHFRKGGQLEDFDPKTSRKAIRALMQEGRKVSQAQMRKKPV